MLVFPAEPMHGSAPDIAAQGQQPVSCSAIDDVGLAELDRLVAKGECVSGDC